MGSGVMLILHIAVVVFFVVKAVARSVFFISLVTIRLANTKIKPIYKIKIYIYMHKRLYKNV